MIFKNSRGMSLAGVLVGVAVLGIVALGMMGLGQHVMQILEIADTKSDVQSEIFILQAALADEATCKANFQGLLPGNAPATLTAHDGVLYMADASGALSSRPVLPSQDKNNPTSRLQVDSLKIHSYNGSPHVALLTVEFSPKKGSSAGALRPREIPVQIELDGSGKIARCSTTSLSAGGEDSSLGAPSQGQWCEPLPASETQVYGRGPRFPSASAMQATINSLCDQQTYPVNDGMVITLDEMKKKCPHPNRMDLTSDECRVLLAFGEGQFNFDAFGRYAASNPKEVRVKDRTGYSDSSECKKQHPFSEGKTYTATYNPYGNTGCSMTYLCVNHYWTSISSGCSTPEKASCFTPEARVTMEDGSFRAIAGLHPGDRVRGRGRVNVVVGIEKVPLDGRPLFSFNGGPAFVTAEHPFLTPNGWKSLNPVATREERPDFPVSGRLGTDDVVLFQGFWERLQKVEEFRGAADPFVYNLLLDGDHTYTVEGYLVHNKGGEEPTGSF